MRSLLMLVIVAVPAVAAEPKLSFKDFWNIAGVTRTSKAPEMKKAWGGEPAVKTEGGETTVKWEHGPSVTLRESGGVMVMINRFSDKDVVPPHKGGPLDLLGMTCEAAAKRLTFTRTVGKYTTCKHYDANGWFIDVTFMCSGTIDTLVVVWEPLPSDFGKDLPLDHC